MKPRRSSPDDSRASGPTGARDGLKVPEASGGQDRPELPTGHCDIIPVVTRFVTRDALLYVLEAQLLCKVESYEGTRTVNFGTRYLSDSTV
jgi:hypothetical protein